MQKPNNTYSKSKQDLSWEGKQFNIATNTIQKTNTLQDTLEICQKTDEKWQKPNTFSWLTLHTLEAEWNFLNQLKVFINNLKLTSCLLVETSVCLLRLRRGPQKSALNTYIWQCIINMTEQLGKKNKEHWLGKMEHSIHRQPHPIISYIYSSIKNKM